MRAPGLRPSGGRGSPSDESGPVRKLGVEVGLAGFAHREHGRAGCGGPHGDVDIFKDGARGDASQAVGRLDQVVSLLAAVFASQGIDEAERLG